MIYLSFVWHMHQPYYADLITDEFYLPWVRLHGIKDYLDMVTILKDFPKIQQTFNIVPSLFEQIQDYIAGVKTDKFMRLSYKEASALSPQEKWFIINNFFSADVERMISIHPRYYELYLKKLDNFEFSQQEILDLQVWFNLAWFDPSFRLAIPALKQLTGKGRFFDEEEKRLVLDAQLDVLRQIIPTYRSFAEQGKIELTVTPYYHPIMPLLLDTQSALRAHPGVELPKENFSYPEDLKWHIKEALNFYEGLFGKRPQGMWPSEESVSEDIVRFIIDEKIRWIVTDESILFKSLAKLTDVSVRYAPYQLKRKDGDLSVIFRDAELSNLIGFVYHRWPAAKAVDDFMARLKNIATLCKDKDALVTVALDGENAWEYYKNDGIDFLTLLYERLSAASESVKTVTVSKALAHFKNPENIIQLGTGSWIYGNFDKWIGSKAKNEAWLQLTRARRLLKETKQIDKKTLEKARRQMYIAEGSDWFWWQGDNNKVFDELYRRHLVNFYTILNEPIPDYLVSPIIDIEN